MSRFSEALGRLLRPVDFVPRRLLGPRPDRLVRASVSVWLAFSRTVYRLSGHVLVADGLEGPAGMGHASLAKDVGPLHAAIAGKRATT